MLLLHFLPRCTVTEEKILDARQVGKKNTTDRENYIYNMYIINDNKRQKTESINNSDVQQNKVNANLHLNTALLFNSLPPGGITFFFTVNY